ncbi:E3 UFM1-protein ligase 1 homolog isoform X1 [Montipora capricornis]|uniref:E3 UFM1-protein ligase 1 homolog isoform X1 n=1 Tax=Montipora capricornis TaxID=246305 RepID=UPI0035F12A05
MADWEEIKRLAADFQRAQLSSTAHKLSERNCIEIVQKLIGLGLVEVIYTTDGKEYLTPQQLEREIKDELFVHSGRVNLVELQQIIGVDLGHIENKASDIAKHDRNLIIIQGELIDNNYLDRVAEEINDTLQESGQVVISELSKTFALSTDFLLEIVEERLGTIIHGQLDQLERGVLFTDAFVARQMACIRGVFSAITKPTPMSTLLAQYAFHEKLLYANIDQLCFEGRISGSIQGRLDKAVFVPDIYSKTQASWIDDFFKQNGYIEYDALSRLGITDGQQFLKRRFHKLQVKFLPTCCIGQSLVDQVEATIDEALSSGEWVDILPLLPSPFTPEDAGQLLQICLKTSGRSSAHVLCDRIVVSEQFLQNCKDPFQQLMQDKARTDSLKAPALFSELTKKDLASMGVSGGGSDKRDSKKEERRKKAAGGGSKGGGGGGGGGSGGGGRGGRESKTQKVRDKKKDRSTKDEELEDDSRPKQKSNELPFMSVEEISEELQKRFPNCSEDLVEEIASYLFRPLTQCYQEVARSVFLSTSDKNRMSHSEVQNKVNVLWANAKLFDKGIKLFADDVQVQLCRHLLKTVCTDMVNQAVSLLGADHMITIKDDSALTQEDRLKIISKLPEKIKTELIKLNTTLSGKETEEFFIQFEVICGLDYCEFMLKKLDKKRERQLTLERRCALQEQLRQEIEPAMALHLASVVLFQHHTGCMLHAPGRCVPQIISYLEDKLSPEHYDKLNQYVMLVIKQLSGSDKDSVRNSENEDQEPTQDQEKSTAAQLEEGLKDIKKIALELKKIKDTNS